VFSRALATAALGAAAALPISCGGSAASLIPTGNAGPLRRDFAAVADAAQKGNGSCSGTETAIARTEQDYRALPAAVDQGLRGRLREGIEKLREDALQLCLQPLAQTTTTSTSAPSTQTTTTPAATQTTPTQTSPTTSTSTAPENGGGTPAPGAGGEQPSEGGGAGPGGGGEGDGGHGKGNGGDGKGNGGDAKGGNGGPGGARPEGGK
jgi:cell division septation protein DedD